MFHMKKVFISFLLILGLFILSGCHESSLSSPSSTALYYYDLIIKQNISHTDLIGISTETAQTILSHIKDNLHTEISKKLSMNGRIEIDPNQIIALEEAYLASLQKLQATVSEEKQEKSYLVTLSTSYIDYNAIDQWAINEALADVNISDFLDETIYLNTLTDAYISYLLTGYQNAEPASPYHEFTSTFTLQNGLWLPDDLDEFIKTLCTLVGTSNKEL